MLVAKNCTDMGKNTDESAGGTTNSIDPLSRIQKWTIRNLQALVLKIYVAQSFEEKITPQGLHTCGLSHQ